MRAGGGRDPPCAVPYGLFSKAHVLIMFARPRVLNSCTHTFPETNYGLTNKLVYLDMGC